MVTERKSTDGCDAIRARRADRGEVVTEVPIGANRTGAADHTQGELVLAAGLAVLELSQRRLHDAEEIDVLLAKLEPPTRFARLLARTYFA